MGTANSPVASMAMQSTRRFLPTPICNPLMTAIGASSKCERTNGVTSSARALALSPSVGNGMSPSQVFMRRSSAAVRSALVGSSGTDTSPIPLSIRMVIVASSYPGSVQMVPSGRAKGARTTLFSSVKCLKELMTALIVWLSGRPPGRNLSGARAVAGWWTTICTVSASRRRKSPSSNGSVDGPSRQVRARP